MINQNVSDQFFNNAERGNGRYPNPFFGIPHQYLPTHMDGMLWWAEQFLLRFGFYRTALQRIADYFITQVNVDCDDEEARKEYVELLEKMNWKAILQESGLNLLAYSNAFISINQGFTRFLNCPRCNKFSLINRLHNFKFVKGQYYYNCPSCNYDGVHKLVDKPVKDVERINVVNWNPREIKLQSEESSGNCEYYWDIPQQYKKKVTQEGNNFYPKVVPAMIYKAINEDRMIEFSRKTFVHLKMPTPSSLKTDGKSVPLSMYMFDNFFMLKVLERYNEVICYEDINPFRVIAMADNVAPSNPIFASQDGGAWAAAVDSMLENHRRDPGSYYKFPFTLNFQQLNGQAKNLAPVELIDYAQKNILNALNIPQELFTMTLQTQAVGPALRLFENSWTCIVDNYNRLLQHIGDVVGKIQGLPSAKFSLMPINFADDMERKSVIGQLVSSNSIARSEFLKLYNFDFEDQLRKKMQEEVTAAEIQEEEQRRQQLKAMNSKDLFNQQQGGAQGAGSNISATGNPQEILAQAEQIAAQLQKADGPTRRQELQKIKAQNETLWSAVKARLQQADQSVQSDALKASKQQGQ